LLVVLILLSTARSTWAQHDSNMTGSGDSNFSVADDGLMALRGTVHVATAPVRWEGDVWIRGVLPGGLITLTAFLLDDETLDLMDRNRSKQNDDISAVAVEYGGAAAAIGIPAALYVGGILFDDEWLRESGLVVGATVVLTSAVTSVSKRMAGRARPYMDLGNHHFRVFSSRPGFLSFPSGHATVAFAISSALAARIGNAWASVGLYGAATAASLSRVYTRDHWLSDVVFAGVYSSAVAHSLSFWFESERQQPDHARGLSVTPTPSGLTVTWRF
jgi:hypothetical protein